MGRDEWTPEYDGSSIYDRVVESTPNPASRRHADFLFYVMGPYTPFDLTYAYLSESFSSASIDEIPQGFGVDIYRYESRTDLLGNLRNFIANVEGLSRYESLELYSPPDE